MIVQQIAHRLHITYVESRSDCTGQGDASRNDVPESWRYQSENPGVQPPGFSSLKILIKSLFLGLFGLGFRLVAGALLEGGTENIAKRGARIGRTVLGNCLLLLGHFQRLNGNADFVSLAVELGDAGIYFLANRESLRPLLAALACKIGTLYEGNKIGAGDLHIDPGLFHLRNLAGNDRPLLEIACRFHRIAGKLFDAERNAFLFDVYIENLRLYDVAFLVLLDYLLARALPVEIGQMDHPVYVAVEAEEQAEFGLVLDFAFDRRTRWMFLDEHLPRIAHCLLEAERNTALDRVDLENLHLEFIRRRDNLARVDVLLGP